MAKKVIFKFGKLINYTSLLDLEILLESYIGLNEKDYVNGLSKESAKNSGFKQK